MCESHGQDTIWRWYRWLVTCRRAAKWCDKQAAQKLWPHGCNARQERSGPRQIWHIMSPGSLLSAVVYLEVAVRCSKAHTLSPHAIQRHVEPRDN